MTQRVPEATSDRTPRTASAPSARNGTPSAALAPPARWASLFFCARPEERTALLAKAAAGRGVLKAPEPPAESGPTLGRMPPVSPELLRMADGCDLPSLELKPDVRADASAPPPPPAAGLSRAQETCLERMGRSTDLFLLRGWPSAELRGLLAEGLRRMLAAGERILLAGADAFEADRLLLRVAAFEEAWPVRLAAAAETLQPALKPFLPAERERSLASDWSRQLRAAAEKRQQRIAALKSLLGEGPHWREACVKLPADQEELTRLHAQQANLLGGLQEDIAADRADTRADWWRQREAEIGRHETERKGLAEAAAKAAADLATADAELKKWRGELDRQAKLIESRSFPNPFSMSWWRAILQGRSAQRLEEFRARVQDAEIQHLSARSQSQIADEDLDVEVRRHAAALEQILKAELDRRHVDLRQAVVARQASVDQTIEKWSAWLRPAAEEEAAGAVPSLERLRTLEERWSKSLQEEMAAAVLEEAQAGEAAQLMPMLGEACRAIANLVVLPAADAAAAGEDCGAWLRPGFDRLVVLGAERLDQRTLSSLASWAGAAMLVGLPGLGRGEPSPFELLWRHLRPSGAPQAMRWMMDGDRWHCLWTGLTPELEGCLQQEPLADRPEIDLFIVAAADAEPRLAALGFPADRYTLAAAKQFHAEEMGEFALDPLGSEWRLREDGDRLIVEFLGEAPGDPQPVPYAGGVTEWTLPVHDRAAPAAESLPSWRTSQLDFDRKADWTWPKVQAWLDRHWRLHDSQRSFETLDAGGRHPALAQAAQLLRPDLGVPRTSAAMPAAPALRWVRPVSEAAAARPKQQSIRRLDGGKVTLAPNSAHSAFNVSEAKALALAAQRLMRSPEMAAEARGEAGGLLSILFVARTAAQLQMVERQWRLLEPAAATAAGFALAGDLAGRHADVVAFSLWPESLAVPALPPTLDLAAQATLSAERLLLLAGELAHLLPPRLLESVPDEAAEQADLRARLRAFHGLLNASAEFPVELAPLGATA